VLKAIRGAQGNAGTSPRWKIILDREYRPSRPTGSGNAFTGRKARATARRAGVVYGATPPAVAPTGLSTLAFRKHTTSRAGPHSVHQHAPAPDPLTNADSDARWEYYSKSSRTSSRRTDDTVQRKPEAGGGGPNGRCKAKYQHIVKSSSATRDQRAAKLAATAVKQAIGSSSM